MSIKQRAQNPEAFERIEADAKKNTIFTISPPFTEDEYTFVKLIYRCIKDKPGTEGKNLAVHELRKMLEQFKAGTFSSVVTKNT